MIQSIRHPEILMLVRRDGKVTVKGLAAYFGVTPQTIRHDLGELAAAGRVERVHGGAILPSGTKNIGYEHRRSLGRSAKSTIASACAALIPNGASLFLNIGTTTEAVARTLLAHRDLLVMTNNLNIANIMADNPDCEVIVTGGALRRSDGGLIGPLASQMIAQFKFDFAVIGCSAVDPEGDILDFDIQEVGVSQAILSQARKSILVADSTKFERSAPARIGSLAQLDIVVTERPLSQSLQHSCEGWRTKIMVV